MTDPVAQLGAAIRFDLTITDSPLGNSAKMVMLRIDSPFVGYALGLEPEEFKRILPDFYKHAMALCDQAIQETRASGIVVASADALQILGKDHNSHG